MSGPRTTSASSNGVLNSRSGSRPSRASRERRQVGYAQRGRFHRRLLLRARTPERQLGRSGDDPRRALPPPARVRRVVARALSTKTSAPVPRSRATFRGDVDGSSFAVWLWLFFPGSTVGLRSRKEILVDRAGDLQSIFEKIRSIVRNLPHYLKPEGSRSAAIPTICASSTLRTARRSSAKRATTSAEAGGPRCYFVDQSAYLDHPQLIEAA